MDAVVVLNTFNLVFHSTIELKAIKQTGLDFIKTLKAGS